MTAIGELAALLASVGLSADVLGQAIGLAQQHANESAQIRGQSADNPTISADDRRRAYDRERQREKRTSAKRALTTLLPSSLSDSQSSKEEIVVRARPVSRGTRIPPDWTPSNSDACFALPLVGERRMAQETEKFRDYWRARAGPNGVKLDWEATWRTWIRKAAESGKHQNVNGTRTISTAADDLIARAEAAERGDDFGAIDVEFHRVEGR